MRQIILDTETTGLSWERGNRVVEIGCVEFVERRPTGRNFHRYLRPDCEFEPGAQADRCAIEDSLLLARQRFPGQRNSLDALCKRLGVDNAHRQLHGALLDAQLLAEVYIGLTSGQEEIGFASADAASAAMIPTFRAAVGPRPTIAIPDSDLQAHQARLAGLRKNVGDAAVVDFLSQPVAAQQQLHAGTKLAGHRLDVEVARVGHAQRLGHHVAMRVAARLLVGDRAVGDQLLHVAVVL